MIPYIILCSYISLYVIIYIIIVLLFIFDYGF